MRKTLVVLLLVVLLNSNLAGAHFGSYTSLIHGLATRQEGIEGAELSGDSLRELAGHVGKTISMHDLNHSTQQEGSRILGRLKIDPTDAMFEVSMMQKESISFANLTSASRLILSSIQGVAQWGDLPESIRDEVTTLPATTAGINGMHIHRDTCQA